MPWSQHHPCLTSADLGPVMCPQRPGFSSCPTLAMKAKWPHCSSCVSTGKSLLEMHSLRLSGLLSPEGGWQGLGHMCSLVLNLYSSNHSFIQSTHIFWVKHLWAGPSTHKHKDNVVHPFSGILFSHKKEMKHWHSLQVWMNPENVMFSERSRHKRPHGVWFHWYKCLEQANLQKVDQLFPETWGGGNENVLELDRGSGCTDLWVYRRLLNCSKWWIFSYVNFTSIKNQKSGVPAVV